MFQNAFHKQIVTTAEGAAGVTTINSSTVALQGPGRTRFVVPVGTVVATGTGNIKVQTGDAEDGSDAADITGLAVAFVEANANKTAVLELEHSKGKAYARVQITRATANSTIAPCTAISERSERPVTQDATIFGTDFGR